MDGKRVVPVEERVAADLKSGRPWKARDRLIGVLRADPKNQWALDQLGDIYFRMGDLPQAGRAWYLTTKTGPEWEAAEAAFYEQYGKKPANVVAALNVRAAIDRYPPAVQERLRTLQRRLRMEGRFWEPRDRDSVPTRKSGGRRTGTIVATIVLIFLTALVVGFYNIAAFLLRSAH